MLTISVLGQKGGSGKTTLAVHLLAEAVCAGLVTAGIDTDPQRSLHRWSQRRKAEPEVIRETDAEELRALVGRAKAGGCELLVIDTAGRAEAVMRETAKLADIVLVPTKLERFDLETLPTVRDTLEFTRATRRAWIVLNMLQPLAVGVQSSIEMTGRELLQRDGWQIAPTGLCRLQDYTASINDGRTAGELAPEGRAAGEMRALWAWLQEECAVHA